MHISGSWILPYFYVYSDSCYTLESYHFGVPINVVVNSSYINFTKNEKVWQMSPKKKVKQDDDQILDGTSN